MEALRKQLLDTIDGNRERLVALSRKIFEHPETLMEEHRACAWICEALQEDQFQIEQGIAGMDTAFRATFPGKADGPVVAILAEYDALPGIGHACGHNLIAGASVGAGIGLRAVMPELSGTLLVLGTPGEEGGGGKIIMVEAGVFDEVDAAIMMHPSEKTFSARGSLAVVESDVTFKGKPAHAAACPEQGINALDAIMQTFGNINALRQQLPEDVRIHGIITEGGTACNIIPERASARIGVRTINEAFMPELLEKVERCARAAALATGATVQLHREERGYAAMKNNRPLSKVIARHIEELGFPLDEPPRSGGMGSVDIGNVSRVIPAAYPYLAIGPNLPGHTEAFRQASNSERGYQIMIAGAKMLALTALDLFTQPDLMEAVRRDFEGSET
jgi:amidohydrolase